NDGNIRVALTRQLYLSNCSFEIQWLADRQRSQDNLIDARASSYCSCEKPPSLIVREAVPLKPCPERGVGQGTFSSPLAGVHRAALVQRPFYFRGHVMANPKKSEPVYPDGFPIDPNAWQLVIDRYALPRQQVRVAEFVLCGLKDRCIATKMKIG